MPYTYLIINKITGMFYYGARYSAKSSPDDLWNTYFTSSKSVKKDIKKYGKDSFTFEVRKVFSEVEECLLWERRVLIRLKAKQRSDCYNLTNGGSIFNSSKRMKIQNPMRNKDLVAKMVETKKKMRLEGRHGKCAAYTEQGLNNLSEKMLADRNPMKNLETVSKMVETKKLRGNTSINTKWIYNPMLKLRKRVKTEVLQEYLNVGWVLGTNLTTERNTVNEN